MFVVEPLPYLLSILYSLLSAVLWEHNNEKYQIQNNRGKSF